VRRTLGAALLLLFAAAACARKVQAPTVQTANVTRRDIIIDAQANGVIEPIAIIEVKSKASGVITKMPVETGTRLNPGDLIVQIDTRDVQNRYDQAKASLDAALAKLTVTESDKKRNEEMFKARVITPQEFEQIAVNYETAKSNVVTARANLDLAKQSLEDAHDQGAVGRRRDRQDGIGRHRHRVRQRLGQRRHDDHQDGRPWRGAHSRAVQRERHRQHPSGRGRRMSRSTRIPIAASPAPWRRSSHRRSCSRT